MLMEEDKEIDHQRDHVHIWDIVNIGFEGSFI